MALPRLSAVSRTQGNNRDLETGDVAPESCVLDFEEVPVLVAITSDDPLPYGIGPNRPMIEELLRQAVAQHILDRPIPVEDLFAPGTLDLVG